MTVYSCPVCAKGVRTDQAMCPHCGRDLNSIVGAAAASLPTPADINAAIKADELARDTANHVQVAMLSDGEVAAILHEAEGHDVDEQSIFELLLERPYNPPELFIFEEVELGGGYHTLSAHSRGPESDWSEPYKKSGVARYRSRIVKVPYPPYPPEKT